MRRPPLPNLHAPRRAGAATLGLAVLLAHMSVPGAHARPATPDGGADTLSATMLSSRTLDEEAIYFVSYDGLVNNASFQQDGILTHGDHQFAAWYTDSGHAMLARRDLTESAAGGTWHTIRLPHRLSTRDSHNTISLGVSANDGRLHVAMDTHNSPVFYSRSRAGLADRPGNGSWTAEAFEPIRRDLNGLDIGDITYPRFIPTPEGDLQLGYRTGGSGNGTMELAEYRAGDWSRIGPWSSPEGEFRANGSVSDSRNLYPHGIDYGPKGRLHVSFTWRETAAGGNILCSPGGLSNHDTGYVVSTDEGRTWDNDAGRRVATTGTGPRVTVDTPGHVVDPLPVDQALMNQESQAIDSGGTPHVMISYVPGRFTHCVTDFAQQRRRWAHAFHLYRDAGGEWHKTELPEPVAAFGRSQLVLTPEDDAYAVLPGGRVLAASAAGGWTDWRLVHDGSGIDAFGEVLVDTRRVASSGVLSIMHQEPGEGTTPSPLRVTDLRLG